MDEIYFFPKKKAAFLAASLACLLTSASAFSQCLKDLTDTKPFTVTTSGASGGYPGTKAFDNADVATSGWKQNTNPSGASSAWVRVNFSTAQVVKGYSVSAFDDGSGNNNMAPSIWRLQGSNDAVSWTNLDTRNGEVFTTRGETHIYTISNTTAYSYYRILISETYLTSSNNVAISEMQLFADVCLVGTVFNDNGDRASAYSAGVDAPLAGVPVSIVTSPVGNVVASTTTNAAGQYSFAAGDIPDVGNFSVMVRPPAGKIFVTKPANLWCNWVAMPSPEEEPATGSVFFGYNVAPHTLLPSAVNRMRFVGGNLDFGLKDAVPPVVFSCFGGNNNVNLIQEGGGGTMGVSTYNWETAHPHQDDYQWSTSLLYSSLPATVTDYTFSNTPIGLPGARGVLLPEQTYTVCSFPGSLSDIGYDPYTSQMLNNVAGGWRKTYGITTGDANDRFMAVNGATSGSLPFFKQSGLALTAGGTYTLAFYGKHANSYSQVNIGGIQDAQLIVEVFDNGNSLVSSGSLNLTAPATWTDDRPEAPWELRMFTFAAPGGSGPFTVQLRASTTASYGNDFYIDNIVLSPCALVILPLELHSFTGHSAKNNDITLNWNVKTSVPATAIIEYGTDGKEFSPMYKLTMQPDVQDYSFVHVQPGNRANYYRLRIVDAMGQITYSSIIRVDLSNGGSSPVIVYPNPVSDRVFVQATYPITNAEVIDATGKLVKSMRTANANNVNINVRDLPSGMYYIKLLNRQGAASLHKIVISR